MDTERPTLSDLLRGGGPEPWTDDFEPTPEFRAWFDAVCDAMAAETEALLAEFAPDPTDLQRLIDGVTH